MRINDFTGEQSSGEVYKEYDLIYNSEEMGTLGIGGHMAKTYRSMLGSCL